MFLNRPSTRSSARRSCRGAVVVTGVSTGIGRAIALELLAQNYLVFGTIRKRSSGRYLQQAGGIPILMDISRPPSIARAVSAITRRLGKTPLLGLVNNAGISVCVPWEHLRLRDLYWQMQVNFFGAVAITQTFIPILRQTRGKIIFISSTSGRTAFAMTGPYASSKFALEALADSLRQEVLRDGIQVVSIEPGPVKTPIWDKTLSWTHQHYGALEQRGELYQFPALAAKLGAAGIAAEQVARAVAKTLSARNPRVRQLVARHAFWFRLQSWLPVRWLDWFAARAIYGKFNRPRSHSRPRIQP